MNGAVWLVAVGALAYAPHAPRLPVWVGLACMSAWGYRLAMIRLPLPRPGRLVLVPLALAAPVAVLAGYGRLFSLEPGIAALALLLSLKLFETEKRRDKTAFVFLAYFLILFNLFYSQSPGMALYITAALAAAQAALAHAARPDGRLLEQLRLAGTIMLQAAPLMAVLFLAFPRLPAGLGIYDPSARVSGLGDTLAPGSISSLALSRETAFRVTFESPRPPLSSLYFRGEALWIHGGGVWSRWPGNEPDPPLARAGEGVRYEVLLEPHGERRLFALDMPLTAPSGAGFASGRTLMAVEPVVKRTAYAVLSALEYETGGLPPWQRRLALSLPGEGNPEARDLAGGWAAEGLGPDRVVEKVEDLFAQGGFVYTLAPPPVPGPDGIDEFLFSTRRGFCGHYASAAAFLLRAAGVPARIVVGYLGGEPNAPGNYLNVRQADAHAWVEAWLPGAGWTRLDPTAVVAPVRTARGMDAFLAGGAAGRRGTGRAYFYWRKARQALDAADYYWSRKVLGYTRERQRELLERMGLGRGTLKDALLALGSALAAVAAALGAAALWAGGRRAAPRPDRALEAYNLVCTRLAGAGLPRLPWQGPLDYAGEVGKARPDLKSRMDEFTALYVRERYGPASGSGSGLLRLARRFRP